VNYFDYFDFLPEIRLRDNYVILFKLISTFSRITRYYIINIDLQISFRVYENFYDFLIYFFRYFGVMNANPTIL
jgi:hypothetical protein